MLRPWKTTMKILQIDSSALGTQSATRELTQAIVQRWLDEVADIELVRRDLDAHPLPHLTGAVLGKSDPADAAQGEAVMGEFLAADVIVLGAPMYNFGVPSTLKAWIDRIAVSGRTFRYTASGPEGLVHGKKVIVASARGSVYGDSHPADFQEAYLRQVSASSASTTSNSFVPRDWDCRPSIVRPACAPRTRPSGRHWRWRPEFVAR
jgi:FMN-dependent NADH-azoreductase